LRVTRFDAESRDEPRRPDGATVDEVVSATGWQRHTRPSPATIPLLLELLEDADPVVAREAACSLGRMGRTEVRPILLRLVQQAPSAEAIDAISAIADEECLVILGRIAPTRPDLGDAALEALDSSGSPGEMKIAAASRRLLGRSATPPE
jgi:hypothetical protein